MWVLACVSIQWICRFLTTICRQARWPSGLRRQTKDQHIKGVLTSLWESGLSGRGFESHSRQLFLCLNRKQFPLHTFQMHHNASLSQHHLLHTICLDSQWCYLRSRNTLFLLLQLLLSPRCTSIKNSTEEAVPNPVPWWICHRFHKWAWVKDKSREKTDSNKQFSGHFTPLNQCNQHAIILHWLSYVRKRCQLRLQSESFIARGLTLSDKIFRRPEICLKFSYITQLTWPLRSTNIGPFPSLCGLCCMMFIVQRQRFFDLLVHLTFPNFAPAYWTIILEHSIGSSNNLVVAPGISSILWKTISFLHETSRNLYVLYKRDH